MPRVSLVAGFKDPVRRPRFIVWTGTIVLILIAVVVVMLGATSTRFFCAEACHNVQDDTIIAYEKSSHSEISCMACHEPLNADPITFVLAKAKAMGELYLTVTDNFTLPLNAGSALALNEEEMGAKQCIQCHSSNRTVTSSPGIIIKHAVHEEKGVWCTACHNRVAHNETGWALTLKGNQKHPNFMKMDACFRCHNLAGNPAPGTKWTAPGTCSACHTPDFNLKPASHDAKDFFPKGHAELAKADSEYVAELKKEEATLVAEGVDPQLAKPVSYCSTCHVVDTFCNGCHGMEMPHPAEFKLKTHPQVAKAKMDKCVMCHGKDSQTHFCSECHHGKKVDWTYSPKVPWINQHATAVAKQGFDKCLGACHEQKFCFDCHTARKPFPSSHKTKFWLHRPVANPWIKDVAGKPNLATHGQIATDNIKECELCHAAGGTSSKFCKGCHKVEIPHPAEFTKFHAKTGRTHPSVCKNCHTFKELCGNCHHEGSSARVSWVKLHGPRVYKKGDTGCFAKCHKSDFCFVCHSRTKPVPASHKKRVWTHRVKASKPAAHTTAYGSQPNSCAYCHGKGGPDTNKFCMSCHKLPMPHPDGFGSATDGGLHKTGLKSGKMTRRQCANCHTTKFCNGCHHNYTGNAPWIRQHDNVVAKTGPQQCFKCHKETYCSHCHVRLIH